VKGSCRKKRVTGAMELVTGLMTRLTLPFPPPPSSSYSHVCSHVAPIRKCDSPADIASRLAATLRATRVPGDDPTTDTASAHSDSASADINDSADADLEVSAGETAAADTADSATATALTDGKHDGVGDAAPPCPVKAPASAAMGGVVPPGDAGPAGTSAAAQPAASQPSADSGPDDEYEADFLPALPLDAALGGGELA